jgi:2-dehydropantoate 2-reductase
MTTPILIVGTGALATLFAARLSAAGTEVTILGTWPAGLVELEKNGACLDGEGKYPVHATNNPMDCKGTKLALVLAKSWQTERVADQLVRCLAEDGLAVTFQNGLGNDEILSGILGRRRVSRGITTLGATLLAPGIVRLSGWGEIILETHPQMKMLEANLRVANFIVDVVEDLKPVIWGKLVINAAINPLTALLRVKNGELLSNQPARELMGRLACETAEVAMALGVTLPFSDPELAAAEVAQKTAQNRSSMLQDVQRGAPTEVDVINGMVVKIGNLYKVTTPVNQVVWSLVKALTCPGTL